jgi:hypothetical protein
MLFQPYASQRSISASIFVLKCQALKSTSLLYAPGGSIMRHKGRGWIMPEADMLSMLRLIDEKICSAKIKTRHRGVLIRLREILENDFNDLRLCESSSEQQDNQEKAA